MEHFIDKQFPLELSAASQVEMQWFKVMVRTLKSSSSGPGLNLSQGLCVVFLDKTLYSQSALCSRRCINDYT